MRPTQSLPLVFLSVILFGAPAFGTEPSPEAQALIEELGLGEADTPVNKRADWKPERIVVMLPRSMGSDTAAFEAQLAAAAGDVELVFDRSGDAAPADELLADADAVIGVCAPELLASVAPDLVWLHNYRVGMDRCSGASDAQKQQIIFTNNKRLSGPGIAEHTVAMLLALTRNLPTYAQSQQAARWDRRPANGRSFGELKGKTVLVAGLGGIGTEIAWRAHGLGMRVIATRNSSRSGPDYVEYVGLADELLTLAGQADVIVNALPLTAATTGLFDKAFFAAAKPGAIFLSVGRGPSTVTADLLSALQTGRLFGAGLDVTDPEPLPKDNPLWQQPNVLITPHVAASGGDSRRRTQIIAVENLRRYVAGEPLLNVVDMNAGY